MSRTFLVLLSCSFLTLACAHKDHLKSTRLDLNSPLKLELVPKLGAREVTQYHSRAVSRVYQENILQKKSSDTLDFQVETIVKQVEPLENRVHIQVRSLNKAGEGDLHEYAIPEVGEDLTMVLSKRAEVVLAGAYPKDSIFYLPTVSLPKDAVQVGDSWQLVVNWVTEKQKIPLQMELVSIFKEIRPCDKEHCALIELSGDVKIHGQKPDDLNLKSDMKGYLYFSLERGSVVWSHVQSEQDFQVGEVNNRFKTCLVSYMIDPEFVELRKKVSPFCRPESELTLDVIP